MTTPAPSSPHDPRPARTVWMLIGGITLARLLYLIFLCPYELVADEAQYWDWSRHLELSYHTKGPAIAWLIAGATHLLGNAEWAVRTPAVLSGAALLAAMALLCARSTRGTAVPRDAAALTGVLLALAIPVYHAASMLMTIDGPYLACWAFAALFAWMWSERESPRQAWTSALGLGVALAIGFLFKYTILLLVPGLVVFALLSRRADRNEPTSAHKPGSALPLLVAGALFILIISPVLIWNHRHGWPTVAHLLGHIHASGGDVPEIPGRPAAPYTPRWTLEYIGVQCLLIGPALVLLLHALMPGAAPSKLRRFALCTALPILLFYLGVSFLTDVEGNWPVAAYLTLIPPTAIWGAKELHHWRGLVHNWLQDPARPKRGFFRRRPETAFQVLFHWSLAYGLVAALGMCLLVPLSKLPGIGGVIPMYRISGTRTLAASVQALVESANTDPTKRPMVIGSRYTVTSLLAYYLPGHASVFCAGSRLGDRRSPYDDFADTDLASPALIGRPAVLVGSVSQEAWSGAFDLENLEKKDQQRKNAIFFTPRYAGPRR